MYADKLYIKINIPNIWLCNTFEWFTIYANVSTVHHSNKRKYLKTGVCDLFNISHICYMLPILYFYVHPCYCIQILTWHYGTNYMDHCITKQVYLTDTCEDEDIFSVVITQQFNPPISQFSRPYNEIRSVCSMFSCNTMMLEQTTKVMIRNSSIVKGLFSQSILYNNSPCYTHCYTHSSRITHTVIHHTRTCQRPT